MFLYSLLLAVTATLLGIPSAYMLAEKKRKEIFTLLDIMNIYTLIGISLLVISFNVPLILETFVIFSLIYSRSLNFFLKILFGYDIRHKVMFLSLGYTSREYFLRYLIPRNMRSIISHFLETFGALVLALIIGKSESIPIEIVRGIQLVSILVGFGTFFLKKLRVSKHYIH